MDNTHIALAVLSVIFTASLTFSIFSGFRKHGYNPFMGAAYIAILVLFFTYILL